MAKTILIERAVIDNILSYAQAIHPKESILLLKGKVDKYKILVNDTQIPPLATHGHAFSAFPVHMLPMDFTTIGVAHSHPSGTLHPSATDLNKFYGRIMVIVVYPYQSERDVAVFDRDGASLKYEVV